MAITVTHSKVSTIPDADDDALVRPSDWNASHTLVGTIDVANGGTGASTLTGYVKGNGTSAMTASATIPSGDVSGLGTIATQNANAVAITGGTINGTTIGATTPAAGTFTTITGQTEVLNGTGSNLLLQSSVLTNAAWSQGAVTLTGSQSDPLGGTTAVLMNDGTTNTSHLIQQNYTTANTLTYTYSFYAKAGTSNYIGIGTYQSANYGIIVNLTNGTFSTNISNAPASYAITSVGSGWYRCSITINSVQAASSAFYIIMSENGTSTSFTGTNKTVYVAAPQLEVGNILNTYIPTTTTAIYGTPTLSFSGVAGLGLESNGSLYVSPAGTGALQAQATTSSTVGGNARGANAVDWQTVRSAASQVASGTYAFIGAGRQGTSSGQDSFVGAGFQNTASSSQSAVAAGARNQATGGSNFIGSGNDNLANLAYGTVVGGQGNTATGYFGFVGNGFTNSTTSSSSVTTQSATMNGTTAVTLSGSNANIKVGQLITGTYITFPTTYVAAISGTSLTLSTVASGSGTSTLSFFTPHGVVVGGGNNQATGSYSFIGGGGDAGTAANRNVASGDYSVVCGGRSGTASGFGSFVGGGGFFGIQNSYPNTASGTASAVVGGLRNVASSEGAFVGSGDNNIANANYSSISGGNLGTARSIRGNAVFPACQYPMSATLGVSQAALLILARQTTDATATALCSDSNAAGTTNQVILPNNSAYFFRGEVVSGVTGGGNTKGWTIEGVIKRGANAASTALVGTPTVVSAFADAGAATWTIAVTADTTNGGLKVTFTGQAATTIRTVAKISTVEMTY